MTPYEKMVKEKQDEVGEFTMSLMVRQLTEQYPLLQNKRVAIDWADTAGSTTMTMEYVPLTKEELELREVG